MPITPQQARVELARRELAKREQLRTQQPTQQQPQIQPSIFETPARDIRQTLGEPEWFSNLPFVKKTDEFIEPWRQRALSAGLGAVNVGLGGIPEFITQKLTGRRLVPQKAPIAKTIGEIGGFVGGVPGAVLGKVGQGLGKIAPSMATLPSTIKGILTGATTGATMLPSPEEAPTLKKTKEVMGQRIGIGAGLGGLTGMIAPQVIKFQRWLKPKNQLALAEEARNSLMGQKNQMIEGFGKQYQSIMKDAQGKTISLQESFKGLLDNTDDIVNTIQGQQEFNEALAKNIPSAKKLLNLIKAFRENPNLPINISVGEADTLQKFIKQMPGIQGKLQRAYKYGFEQVDWTNSERILLDFANDIKASVLDLAPELRILNQNYGQFMNNFKQIRPYLKWNNAVTNMKNLHNLDPAILEKFQQTLPKNIIDNVLQMNRTVRNAELLKRMGIKIGEGTVLGAVGYGIYRGSRR